MGTGNRGAGRGMMEFVNMGGYGAYIWSAYGITLMVLVFNIWWAYRVHGKSLKKLNEVVGDFAKRQPIVRQVP